MYLAKIKETFSVLASGHTLKQKLNYIKYLFSAPLVEPRYRPITISIVATNRCNLGCNMCPTHSGLIPDTYPYKQKVIKDMDFGIFKKVVDKFPEALTVNIIGSGEPLLNKDLFKMAEYAAKHKRMKVKTFSNGILIKEKADELVDSCLDGITISINGHNAGEFARMTGMSEDFYQKIYDGVRDLVKKRDRKRSGLKVKLAFIIDKSNYKHIDQMIDVVSQLNADHAYLCNFLPCPYEGFTVKERVLTTEDIDAVETIKGITRFLPKNIRKKITLPYILDMNAKKKKCRSHFVQVRVDGEGNVNSCSVMLLNMIGHGNFEDENIWNKEFFKDMRGKFMDQDARLDDPCAVCVENYGIYPW